MFSMKRFNGVPYTVQTIAFRTLGFYHSHTASISQIVFETAVGKWRTCSSQHCFLLPYSRLPSLPQLVMAEPRGYFWGGNPDCVNLGNVRGKVRGQGELLGLAVHPGLECLYPGGLLQEDSRR